VVFCKNSGAAKCLGRSGKPLREMRLVSRQPTGDHRPLGVAGLLGMLGIFTGASVIMLVAPVPWPTRTTPRPLFSI